mgnify:FL=1|jgi:hypothetical protein
MFVMRFPSYNQTNQLENITLPIGISATAYTQGDDWYAIIDDQNIIHIFNLNDNSLRQTIQIKSQ